MTLLTSTVETIVDAARLSELLGRPARATSLRVKPGASVIAGYEDELGGGWLRVLLPSSWPKAGKVVERAERHGLRATSRDLPGGLLLVEGEIAADRVLAAPLRRARKKGLLGSRPEVLRYNPLRRLVARAGDATVRVTAAPDAEGRALARVLTKAGVPLPERRDKGRDPHLAVQAFLGDTDLARTPDGAATEAAGAALAGLHRALPGVPGTLLRGRCAHCPDPVEQAHVHLALLQTLDLPLAGRLAGLLGRAGGFDALQETVPSLVHGDASPDQVLLDSGTGRVWLTDFDRVCVGAAALDLGSYLAAAGVGGPDGELGRALLAGYRAGGGTVPGDGVLRLGMARARLLGLVDPLRKACPDWRARVGERLDRLAEVLS